MTAPAVEVADVAVEFPRAAGAPFRAVDGVTLAVRRGETLGLVGESGSGKSMLALAMLGLVPAPGRVSGRIAVAGEAVTGASEATLRRVRGGLAGMVFQDPLTGLNPVRSIGSLLVEAARLHNDIPRSEARARARAALEAVGIPAPELRLKAYPHELSGGLRQRAMIALALINRPALILADEPTTALDATIQAQILELFRERVRDAGMILITHDLGVAAEIGQRLAVMYAGRIVEEGPVREVLAAPRHPYTLGLKAARPRFARRRARLVPIPGAPPGPNETLDGCKFAPRCARRTDACARVPPLAAAGDRRVACWHPHGGPA